MSIKAVHSKLDEIPEQYQDLYTERDGKYELTGVQGIKTLEDVSRVTTALERERSEHKSTKELLTAWGDKKPDEVMAALDRIPELELAAKGKLEDAQIDELVEKRSTARVNGAKAPLERKIEELSTQLTAATEKLGSFEQKDRRRTIHDATRKAMVDTKVRSEAQDDVLMWSERLFEIAEDGKVVTRDGVGVLPGLTPDQWLVEQQESKFYWWGDTGGGGARGGTRGSTGGGATNPWKPDQWNMTEQGRYVREHGMAKAETMAKAAGTKVGGGPAKK